MQDGQIDYSSYSRPELVEALAAINRDKFPRNYENLRKALETAPIESAQVQGAPPAEPTQPPDPLSLVPRSAYMALRRHSSDAANAMLVPSLVILATSWMQPAVTVAYVVTSSVQLICWAVLAVRLHRLILLSPAASETATLREYGWYLAWTLSMLGLIAVWVAAPLLLKEPGVFVLWLLVGLPAMVYFSARLSLILPDRALGQTTPLRLVWSWSTDKGWTLVFFVVAPAGAINALVGFATKLLPTPWGLFLQMLLLILVTAFQIASLSCAYQLLALQGDGRETEHGA